MLPAGRNETSAQIVGQAFQPDRVTSCAVRLDSLTYGVLAALDFREELAQCGVECGRVFQGRHVSRVRNDDEP